MTCDTATVARPYDDDHNYESTIRLSSPSLFSCFPFLSLSLHALPPFPCDLPLVHAVLVSQLFLVVSPARLPDGHADSDSGLHLYLHLLSQLCLTNSHGVRVV